MSAFNDPRLLKLERERREGPKCRECGYDLSGLTLVTPCPECGTARQRPEMVGRLDPQGAKILDVGRLELWRFQVGFGLAGVALVAMPVQRVLLVVASSSIVEWVGVGIAGAWALGVYVLLSSRFYDVKRGDRFSEPARFVALATQWMWVVAVMMPATGAGGGWVDAARLGLIGLGAVGLAGTFWELGNLLEWAGDDAGGKRVRVAVPGFIFAMAWAFLGLTFFMFSMPAPLLWIAVLSTLIFLGPLAWFYLRILAAVLGGMSMARWARVQQVSDAGRGERIAAHRAAIDAETAAEVGARERAHLARHTKVDESVSVDDFLD